ncbi:MAG: hypothetical protein ACE5EO_00040 [Candidatus Krumholzibacteriia bacterium]
MNAPMSHPWRSTLVLLCLASAFLFPAGRGTPQTTNAPNRDELREWLVTAERLDGKASGLYPYYRSEEKDFESSPDDFLSPMVSAKCILFWLEEDDVWRAARIADRLLYWQEAKEKEVHPAARGALPSQITWSGGEWVAGDRYYSSDNLVILEAFLLLYERTQADTLLSASGKIATWFKDVMCHGERFGVWREEHGAPMQFVTDDGAFNNKIFTAQELLWIDALRHFGELSGKMEYIEQFEKSKAFLLRGQSRRGVWFDHYDPGYPPKSYDSSRWHWYGSDVVVADNALRAALGAYRVGAREQAERFADWLQPVDGAVYAYLNVTTGSGRFNDPTQPYYDVVASGLWRQLARKLGRPKEVASADRFLQRTQNRSGGWYWGLSATGLRPLHRTEAVLTGLWAVSNLNL